MTQVISKLCSHCLRKHPPVETELIIESNITQNRFNRGDYICEDCLKERGRMYASSDRTKYVEYLQQLHDETVEELSQEWQDPAYGKLSTPERVYKIWDKYGRRYPAKGVRKSWILEVIMPELWFIDANGIVEDFFQKMYWTKSKQIAAKQYILEFVVSQYEFLLIPYRKMAEHRWTGIIEAIEDEHQGRDKMVAKPQYEDPITKEMIFNWFLLSRHSEQQWREQMREEMKARADIISEQEGLIVDRIEAEVLRNEQEQRENPEGAGAQN